GAAAARRECARRIDPDARVIQRGSGVEARARAAGPLDGDRAATSRRDLAAGADEHSGAHGGTTGAAALAGHGDVAARGRGLRPGPGDHGAEIVVPGRAAASPAEGDGAAGARRLDDARALDLDAGIAGPRIATLALEQHGARGALDSGRV